MPLIICKIIHILTTINHKIFDTNSCFHVKAHKRKSLISVFQELSASVNKTLKLAGSLGTRISFHGV